MESYSPFFKTLHDERSPTGHLGNGTHASILRAMVFHGPNLTPFTPGVPTDLAVIWDEDHDTRVIKAIESIYRDGFLGSILMIGERKGTLHAILSEDVKSPALIENLETKLRKIAKRVVSGDPWLASLRPLNSPDHEIIDDDADKVSLYLANLKMLWRLGNGVSFRERMKLKRLEQVASKEKSAQIAEILRGIPGEGEDADKTRLELFYKANEELKAEKLECAEADDVNALSLGAKADKSARKIRLVER